MEVLTINERIRAYEDVLNILSSDTKYESHYICVQLYSWVCRNYGHRVVDQFIGKIEKLFPELYSFKPEELPEDIGWFKNKAERIQVLKKCLDLCKSQALKDSSLLND